MQTVKKTNGNIRDNVLRTQKVKQSKKEAVLQSLLAATVLFRKVYPYIPRIEWSICV